MSNSKKLAAVGESAYWSLVMAVPMLLASISVAVVVVLSSVGIGLLVLPAAAVLLRQMASQRRWKVAEWRGVEMADPYQPVPEFSKGWAGHWQKIQHYVTDFATWRDAGWLWTDPVVGWFLAVLPIGLILEGIWGIVITFLWNVLTESGFHDWYTFVHVTPANADIRWATSAVGVLLIALGFAIAPAMLNLHARWSRVLLAPTQAQLQARLRHLAATRADAIDTQAAELRRIERDLHDGAQARLVAMGMHLNAASQLMDQNPDAARAMLLEARDSSAKALTELRDLVRGIHPPVLADRGLVDAVRALALDCALDVDVHAEVPGRLDAPLESAAYFAVGEALANAAKHSAATHVWVDLRVGDGMLRISVMDDGVGGADLADGTGLRGIERRLATFDGILALSSPQGGPTVVTMELPCVSSSPKTSSSSGTA